MSILSLKRKIKNKIWVNFKDYFYSQRVIESPIVMNINSDCSPNQKNLLICYVTYGYFYDFGKSIIGRTIPFEIFKIVNVFSELGYCIDIIGCNDVKTIQFVKSKQYSLIFGFGETFYQIVKMQPLALSILYMTENHPNFSFQEEKKRNDYFYERHSKKIVFSRSGIYYHKRHMEIKYSYVITLSETEPLKNQYDNPFTIYPTGIVNPNYIFKIKNHQYTKNNFLWLGSAGAIHKGLDLLIDVFNRRNDIVLHICGLSNIDRKILNLQQRDNIIEYGHIDIKSELFLEIIETCSFIILPSCSEGFSTSITTGMMHGLIPIVMKGTGFDRLNDNAIYLNDYSIEYLDTKLSEFQNYNLDELKLFSKKVFDFAQQNFSISTFEENFRKIIIEITKKAPRKLGPKQINLK
jgi:hypothetical protein